MTANSDTIDTTQFNDTPVIKRLKKTQAKEDASSEPSNDAPANPPAVEKKRPGRKVKYATNEERIAARRAQQKAYRDRKRQQYKDLIAGQASTTPSEALAK